MPGFPGGTQPEVSRLDLEITEGELLVLVGSSECGKSALLGVRPRGHATPQLGNIVKVQPIRTYVFDTEGDRPRVS